MQTVPVLFTSLFKIVLLHYLFPLVLDPGPLLIDLLCRFRWGGWKVGS